MKTVNKIMVAVDFSDHSKAAAQYAGSLAKDVDAKVLLIHIFNQRDVDMWNKVEAETSKFSAQKYIEEHIENRKYRLGALAKKIGNDHLDVETDVRIGVPYEALLQEIRERKPDLLVMGTKGRSNLVDTIMGSCAQKMFRRSPIPLLSIRGNQSTD